MIEKKNQANDPSDLRRKAEKALSLKEAKHSKPLTAEEMERNLHELRVHQIELEMQNEELRRTQAELDAERARYFDLYFLAPLGYVTVTEKGMISEANLATASMLGIPRGTLLNCPFYGFIFKEDQDIFYLHRRQLFESGETKPFEIRMLKKDGTVFWVYLAETITQDANSVSVTRITLSDITERKRAEDALRESHQIIQGIMKEIPVRVFWKDKNLVFLGCNEVFARDAGFTDPKDIIGKDDYQMVWRDQAELYRSDDQQVIESGRSKLLIEEPQTTPEGKTITLLTSKMPLINANGEISGVLVTYMDITERKKAEEALRESENRYATTLAAVDDGLWDWHVPSGKAFFNAIYYRMLGYEDGGFTASYDSWRRLVHPNDVERVEKDLRQSLESKEGFNIDLRMKMKSGEWLWVCARGKAVEKDANGKALRMVGTLSDITERKNMEMQLVDSRKMLQLVINNVPQSIFWKDRDLVYLGCNINFAKNAGVAKVEDIVGKTDYELAWKKEEADFFRKCDVEVMQSDSPMYHIMETQRQANGKDICLDTNKMPLRDVDGKVVGILGSFDDITERKKAEDALRESEEKLQNLFVNAPIGIFHSVVEGRFLSANPTLATILGYSSPEELISLTADMSTQIYADPNMRPLIMDALIKTDGWVHNKEVVWRRKDRRLVTVDITGRKVLNAEGGIAYFESFIIDITERKLAERRQLLLSEILGILNNPVALPDMINCVLSAIKRETGLDAAGIRLKDGDDYPYFSHDGFSKDFVLAENTLIVRDKDGGVCRDANGNIILECTCGLLVSGKTDPANPLFTPDGSFWTNNSFPLLDLPSESDPRIHPRNRCIHEGYCSVALIPIRANQEIVGLLQLNNLEKDSLTLDMIHFFESICANIGMSLMQRQAEEEAKKEQAISNAIIDSIPGTFYMLDENGRYVRWNAYQRDEIVGKTNDLIASTNALDTIHPDDRSLIQSRIVNVMTNGVTETVEGRVLLHGGPDFRWLLMTGRQMVIDGHQFLVGIGIDITERKQAEEDYRTLFTEMLDGFALHEIICDSEGNPADYRFLAVNPAFERMTGLKADDLVGKTVLETLPNTERYWIETYGNVALTGKSAFLKNYSSELGKYFEVTAFRPAPMQFACIFADVTGRKKIEGEKDKLQQQLMESQKMQAVGQLAGGISHDFNNLLSVINGYAQLLIRDPKLKATQNQQIGEILRAGERAAELTRQLLVFSRRQAMEFKIIDLNTIVSGTNKMLRRIVRENIDMAVVQGSNLGKIKADPGQIEQVIMNLVVNASDAMPNGGTMTIKTENVKIGGDWDDNHEEIKPGRYVMLSVSDTGCGMDNEVKEHIFEPFFTTKEVGKGTGLGLAIIYGVIKQSNAYIDLQSEPGKGTKFQIYFPQVVEDVAPSEERHSVASFPRGAETIMIAEDEEGIRLMLEGFLQSLGYTVLTACDGKKALEIAESHKGKINLLLTDIVMPGMNGFELGKKLKKAIPDIKLLFMSGYVKPTSTQEMMKISDNLIDKPVSIHALSFKLREILG